MEPIAPQGPLKARVKLWKSYPVKDSPGKSKPTLESLLKDRQVITGKRLIERNRAIQEELDKQKAIFEEAIEFERRNRKQK